MNRWRLLFFKRPSVLLYWMVMYLSQCKKRILKLLLVIAKS